MIHSVQLSLSLSQTILGKHFRPGRHLGTTRRPRILPCCDFHLITVAKSKMSQQGGKGGLRGLRAGPRVASSLPFTVGGKGLMLAQSCKEGRPFLLPPSLLRVGLGWLFFIFIAFICLCVCAGMHSAQRRMEGAGSVLSSYHVEPGIEPRWPGSKSLYLLCHFSSPSLGCRQTPLQFCIAETRKRMERA